MKGRFHAFDLARELAARRALAGLLTTYPASQTRRFGIDGALVTTRVLEELRRRARQFLPGERSPAAHVAAYERFDRSTCAWLRADADVFIGWSGASLAALQRASSLGLATWLERGSTHAAWARRKLLAVYDDAGLRPRVAPLELVEREQAEYALADRIAVPSSFAERTFHAYGVPAAKLVRIPYGVDLDAFRAPATRGSSDVFRVLFVGAVSVRKGVLTLLDAFRRVPAAKKELVLVGRVEPALRHRLAGRDSDVRIVGSVPQERLRAHYAAASVFCLPSHEEGLALVLAQAMAAGRAIVASHASGAGDLVVDGEHGFLSEDGDVDALTERLTRLADAPELAVELGRRGALRVASGFAWRDYGDRVQAELARLMAARR
ncbi:MAG: glycosyltransferase family 4 protein [Planctomycetota bacterium]